MSAANDSTASAAAVTNPSVDDNAARLDQPSDAVPMETMSQPQPESSSIPAPASSDAAPASAATQAASVTDAGVPVTSSDKSGATADAQSTDKSKDDDETAASTAAAPKVKDRSDSIMAIGPAQDDITSMSPGGADGPVCQITLLLTTGTRHPYKIDARYLSRRNVPIPDNTEAGQPDPFSISVYTLKELILREWRSDWETKPASPSSIRLIHFGKLLDDKEQLKKYQFATDHPNVVHMSIRPQDLDEEEPKSNNKATGSGGAGSMRERSSNCCVIL
ncbi:ubiquitin-2 like rad60 SUMO-like domain-containing protein [Sarocladium implicatum]|nr:ubiquitin-2 like rad60 SUMO-like domain-containing protein [Sarocladium implicatum]